MSNFEITYKEREYLRELAKKQAEYASLPVMDERKKLWYKHNSLEGERPVVVMEELSFEDDILPVSKCQSPAAKEIERELNRWIINHELIDDDKVVPPYYTVYWKIRVKQFGLDIKIEHAEDMEGRNIGYKINYPARDVKEALDIIQPSTYWVDREYTLQWRDFVDSVIGDILPVKIKNNSLTWYLVPSMRIVYLIGLEEMMIAMMDYPNEVHNLYEFIKDDMIRFLRWQEKEGLLTLNNENDYAGSGSYGFTSELPSSDYAHNDVVRSKDIWGNLNSQETVGISSDMYGEFVFPYYYDLAKEFGLVYYGCCEPIHSIWDEYISRLPNLRKVSISPWCDENLMGSALSDGSVIYSRKPSPNFIGVKGNFDEEAFSEHIKNTLKVTRGCKLEFIYRDILTLSGDIERPGKAIKIIRELIDKYY